MAMPTVRSLWGMAFALSLGAAISLGMARFSYAMLLPPMREDLAWSYTLAGAMNTANALGYLLGALALPRMLRRWDAVQVFAAGAVLTSLFMGLSGFFVQAEALLLQRTLAGLSSAWVFVAGGLLTARLGQWHPASAGWLLGLYYGGTGWGIIFSALTLPPIMAQAQAVGLAHPWVWAWWCLCVLCTLCCVFMWWPLLRCAQWHRDGWLSPPPVVGTSAPQAFAWPVLSFALMGYGLFGVGYIGYMTFVVALLREQGQAESDLMLFYALLGCAVLVSSRLWSGLLNRAKAGGALAMLNGLLGVATLVPALTQHPAAVMASGLLFGAVFLSVVASTTALVRHNLPAAQWAAGISAFTIVFAMGQILGPVVVGWISDGPGGLARGLVFSAGALLLGALLAWRQKSL
ncbi:MAG: YbfB/YjiJ family MFS transporter [Betaproteobacteria bacterium]|nr:YbfB/YjiJ family MFS transporter [Betaproteobacteria bacterium]